MGNLTPVRHGHGAGGIDVNLISRIIGNGHTWIQDKVAAGVLQFQRATCGCDIFCYHHGVCRGDDGSPADCYADHGADATDQQGAGII
ncbi:hypothetical protein MalM14_18040 [Gimesia chilikensis]|nr:hypothetical protein MalM14_18040 [Gimesia chilikensis]